MRYEVKAPAKVNIYLKLCGTLPNGYHELSTLMQTVNIFDTVTVEINESKEEIIIAKCVGRDDIPSEKNLCYKAADRFFAMAARKNCKLPNAKVNITVDKNIPSEAGLGGGSSDAAAVVRILQKHFNHPLNDEELIELSRNIGADTAFFLRGGSQICEGIGEIMTDSISFAGIPMIILKPSEGVSTPLCFKAADYLCSGTTAKKELSAIKTCLTDTTCAEKPLKILADNEKILQNDLQKPAESFVTDITRACELLSSNGASFVRMSGSGSAVFGMFDSENSRDKAFEAIKKADSAFACFACETI